MESTKYPYTLKKNLLVIIAGLVLMITLLYAIITHSADHHIFISIVPVFLLITGLMIYLCITVYRPYLRGETALELNNELLQDFSSKNKIIYWKEVDTIDPKSLKKDKLIRFIMKNGGKDINISTKYIAGDDKEIYEAIMQYFEKNKNHA